MPIDPSLLPVFLSAVAALLIIPGPEPCRHGPISSSNLPRKPSMRVASPAIAALLLLAAASAIATPLPPAAKAEVVALLARLESSGCKFNRNGTWYTSQEAHAHLQGKLEYLEKKTQASTAEAFIELAATSSSITGKPYLVQCQGEQPVPSATWLAGQLAAVRKQAGSAQGAR